MATRKINGWDYPYKVWPEDFNVQGIFSDEFVSEQIGKYNFPKDNEFRSAFVTALENAAQTYYGDTYFKGKNANSSKDITKQISNLSSIVDVLYKRLESLPLELFEEFVETISPRQEIAHDPYQLEDVSHYRQCVINEQLSLPVPSIESFYKMYKPRLNLTDSYQTA